MPVFDDVDAEILETLQRDGRLSNAKLAKQLSLSEPACWRRVRRLEAEGLIEGYRAVLSRRALGLGLLSFVQLGFAAHDPASTEAMERIVLECPNVLSCHNTTGEADFLLQVIARDLDDYSRFVEEVLRNLPGVVSVTSNLSLREIKPSALLPVRPPVHGAG